MPEIDDPEVIAALALSLTGDADAAPALTAVVSAGQNTIVGRVAGEALDALDVSEIPEADSEAGVFVLGFTADGNLAKFPVEDGIPSDAPLLTSRASDALLAEVNLGLLSSGLIKHTVTAGVSVPATAVENTDYAAAAHAARHGSGGADAITVAESQVTGLTAALAGKSATTHDHAGVYAPLYPEYGVYASGNTSSIAANAYGVIALDTAFAAVSGFAVSAGEVTLPAAGRYRVEYDVGAEFTTANTKGRVTVNLQTDNGGSWATVTGASADVANPGGSGTTLYQRDAATGRGYVTTTGTNKKLRLYAGPAQDAGSAVVFRANECRLTVTQVPA